MHKKQDRNMDGIAEEDPIEKEQINLLRTQVHPTIVGSEIAKERDPRRHLIHFLVTIFGMGNCLGFSSIAAELPLLVITAPEGSALPSLTAIPIVTAFIFPTLYALVDRCAPRLKIRNEPPWITGMFLTGIVAMGFLAFFHDVTITINGVDYSIVMLILLFVFSIVAASRNVLLLPYLRNFEDTYLTSFFVGEGLSGLLPSIVALIQGIGGEPICPNDTTNSTGPTVLDIPPPNFPARDYFLFVSVAMAFSTCCFWALEYIRVQKSQRNKNTLCPNYDRGSAEHDSSKKFLDEVIAEKTCEMEQMDVGDQESSNPTVPAKNSINYKSKIRKIYPYVMMWIVCVISNSYVYTLQAFSCRPYGNVAYHLVVNLSQLASTLACVLSFWLPPIRDRSVILIMCFILAATSYVSWLAMSPIPLWRDSISGVILLITIWVLLMGCIFYMKLALTAIIWREPNDANVFRLAFVFLLGTICSSSGAFVLVNFTSVFTPYNPCQLAR